jgi:hypothetical protein
MRQAFFWVARIRAWRIPIAVMLCACVVLALLFKPSSVSIASLEERPNLSVRVEAARVQFVLQARAKPLRPGVPWMAILYTPAGPIAARGKTRSGETSMLSIKHVRAGLLPYKVLIGATLDQRNQKPDLPEPFRFEGTVSRKPGLPITPLDLKVGARAARVVGNRPPALVLHPLDVRQNVSDQSVLVRARRPDRGNFTRTIPVKHLTAWTYIPTGLKTGVLKITASSAGAMGERAEVDVQPGPVVSGTLKTITASVPADRREWWDLRLENAKDALGNLSLNGTVVEFNSRLAPSRSAPKTPVLFAARPTVRATASLDLPPTVPPGKYPVRASSEAYRSSPDQLTAQPPISVKDIDARWLIGASLELAIGPLVDRLGALPDDGTPVKLELLGNTPNPHVRLSDRACGDAGRARRASPRRGQLLGDSSPLELLYSVTVPLQQGGVTWKLPPLPLGSRCVRLEVAGQRMMLALPRKFTGRKP